MSASRKRKLEQEEGSNLEYPTRFLADVNAEIQLEIALRQRLVDSFNYRIAWATMLQESLQNASGDAPTDTFRTVALDALQSLEASSDFILAHDPPPPLKINVANPRPHPRKDMGQNMTRPKPSYLFIRSSDMLHGNGFDNHNLYLLKCPKCSRTSFTSLQGLLNHARLAHNLEWGTHDECIRACAIADNNLDVTYGNEVRLGPMGILPGLRTIFQMAVANGHGPAEDTTKDDPMNNHTHSQLSASTISHLNQTLGIHEETPALAPFLGKESIRRQIKSFDEDTEVDIEVSTPATFQRKSTCRPWRMTFAHRNFLQMTSSSPEDISTHIRNNNQEVAVDQAMQDTTPPSSKRTHATTSTQSRFHLVSRIIITDRNLWIPPEQRSPEYKAFTHKWMISVSSPSYTHHITSILTSLRVTPSNSDLSIPTPPVTRSPPFIVVGLSDRPFLAKIELTFSGTGSHDTLSTSDQKLVFEHWVDLYPLQPPLSSVVVGEDQVVDIDLDKNTILKPLQLNYIPIDAKSHWYQVFQPAIPALVNREQSTTPIDTEAYEKVLAKLMKRFPMTLSDYKGKRSHLVNLPYTLPTSREQLWSFVTGRRKAIEWGRARAIREAYGELLASSSNGHLAPLSVADVYAWLSEKGHFLADPRRANDSAQVKREPFDSSQRPGDMDLCNEENTPIWCKICGLEMSNHTRPKIQKVDPEMQQKVEEYDTKISTNPLVPTDCPIVPKMLQISRLPRLDIQEILTSKLTTPQANKVDLTLILDNSALSSAADPNVTISIYKLTNVWRLCTFHHPQPADMRRSVTMPMDVFGTDRKAVEKRLAPHALLSLIAEQFIRALVARGLEVANRDKLISTGLVSMPSRKRNRNKSDSALMTPSLLTPTHILSGIFTRGQGRTATHDPLDAVLLLCLSKLGVTIEEDVDSPNSQGIVSTDAKVKLESI